MQHSNLPQKSHKHVSSYQAFVDEAKSDFKMPSNATNVSSTAKSSEIVRSISPTVGCSSKSGNNDRVWTLKYFKDDEGKVRNRHFYKNYMKV